MINPEFKWKHFASEIILWCLRWYGSTIYRWFIEYASALRKKLRRHQFIQTDSSW
jgi:transposase, IS6 family